MAEHQQAEAGGRDQRVDEHRQPRRRHVHVHDLGGVALLVVRRGGEERHVKADGDENGSEPLTAQGSRRADSAMKRVGFASRWVSVCMAMI